MLNVQKLDNRAGFHMGVLLLAVGNMYGVPSN